jgi:UDP-N-acetylmuramoyl-tripeptide--D-alanyl-D-alanine ligase
LGDPLHLTFQWVAEAVGGEVRSGNPESEVGRIVTDSRVLRSGDFFVALRGGRHDGHGFVPEAFSRGAAGAMVERGFGPRAASGGSEGAVIAVEDTTKGLQDLAHAIRRASGSRVVAITGSAGKTTTKEIIAAFLSERFHVVKNEGNLNNHIGLPLSLLQLRERPDVAVMELGMNHAGEISTLVAIAEPGHRVWTNVGDAHIGFFGSPDAIADAKAEILERAGSGDVLVCNADDPLVMARAPRFAGRLVTFGTRNATVSAADIEDRGILGTRARVVSPQGQARVSVPLLGRGNLENVLAATAVALDFGVPLDEIVSSAARLAPANRRGVVRPLRSGTVLIDDSYNSSPSALAMALEVVAREKPPGRKVVVLGEMLELGDSALELHERAGQQAAAAGVNLLFVVGGDAAKRLARAAVESGMSASDVFHLADSESAAHVASASVRAGDLVLVKGSRGVHTDIVADRIASEHS